jgi:PAS domain S-box-containing protein
MTENSIARLRSRLETARADAAGATAHELDLCLAELEVLWEELESQADHLARERERYRHFFDYAPFACVVTDVNGMLREANRAAYEVLGAPAASLAGKPLAVCLAEADRPAFRNRLVRAAIDPKRERVTWSARLKLPDGRQPQVELSATALPVVKGAASLVLFLRRA